MDRLRYKARGALSNPDGRYESMRHEAFEDGWESFEETPRTIPVTVLPDKAKTVINYNKSPDVWFDRSINPYRGCEHGCIYCFARPTHSYWGLSPGLDFETQLFYKDNAVDRLIEELDKPGYQCKPIALGINTDAYQPLERTKKLTRQLLEVLLEYKHPVSLITKSQLIVRDIDLLEKFAKDDLVSVMVSITSLDNKIIKSALEPRAASAAKRLEVIRSLTAAGIPVGVMVAPVIPFVTDAELEKILQAAFDAGAKEAGYVLLRLPHEVKDLFRQWLEEHYPDKAAHVMSLIRQSQNGKDYNPEWGTRMRGTGQYAELLAQRFSNAYRRIGFSSGNMPEMNTGLFGSPQARGKESVKQLSLPF